MKEIKFTFEFSFGRRFILCLLIISMIVTVVPELGSESVTLTTYYPAPSGVYTNMITTSDTYLARDGGRVGIGLSAPGSILDVQGRAGIPTIYARTVGGADALRVIPNNDVNGGSIAYGIVNAANTNWLNFSRYNGQGFFSAIGVGAGKESPGTTIDVAQNGAIRVGNAVLSSGGDYMNLASHEHYDGSNWIRDGSPGALIQINSNLINFFSHDGVNASGHTTSMRLSRNGHLTVFGGAADCREVTFTTPAVTNCNAGEYATLTAGIMSPKTMVRVALDVGDHVTDGVMLCCSCASFGGTCPSL
jgi:hypothetical protein